MARRHPRTSRRGRGSACAAHVALLGHFDAYLLGYRSRDLVLDARFAKRIQAGGGIIKPAVLVGGRVVGTWRGQHRRGEFTIAVEPFEQLADDLQAGLDRERADLARFLRAKLAQAPEAVRPHRMRT